MREKRERESEDKYIAGICCCSFFVLLVFIYTYILFKNIPILIFYFIHIYNYSRDRFGLRNLISFSPFFSLFFFIFLALSYIYIMFRNKRFRSRQGVIRRGRVRDDDEDDKAKKYQKCSSSTLLFLKFILLLSLSLLLLLFII